MQKRPQKTDGTPKVKKTFLEQQLKTKVQKGTMPKHRWRQAALKKTPQQVMELKKVRNVIGKLYALSGRIKGKAEQEVK